MGYCMQQRNSHFFMKAEDKPKALQAIKDLAGKETITDGSGRHFSWVNTEDFVKATTLEDALDEWRWHPEVDDDGNIIDLWFEGEKLGDDIVLFEAIAPFVRPNSTIEMQGEEGALWRWRFGDGFCYEEGGTVAYII